eukprot:TRINITY_DN4806_c0_g2_i1.p1 TRINITY_DN4806_c0_g2~~TRINITY_DN4806_c0_g2_i1.p1  ORF type:complete len:202 (+),score=24.25 TRINITY_DN4806_c0_g2_i1:45-650(+)
MAPHRRRKIEDYDLKKPIDEDEQEEICLGFEESHRQSSGLFSKVFGAVCLVVAGLFLWLAYEDERYHFKAASSIGSIGCSLCVSGIAILCALRMWTAGKQTDEQFNKYTASLTHPALALALFPTCYHLYLSIIEIYGTVTYLSGGDGFSLSYLTEAVHAHHVLFIWPVTLILLTFKSAQIIKTGFDDIDGLRKVRYSFKTV